MTSKTYSHLENVQISWSVSRGRDTYGYNICRAYSPYKNKTYKTCGGGYDMIGTVIGDYMQDSFQSELRALKVETPDCQTVREAGYTVPGWKKHNEFYGLTYRPSGEAILDGVCGIESILKVAHALGFEVQRTHNKKGRTTGYIFAR